MRKTIECGEVFGDYRVISKSKTLTSTSKSKYRYTNCLIRCKCGYEKTVKSGYLKRESARYFCDHTKRKKKYIKFVHYSSRHPLYSVWRGIKRRCYNKNMKQYKDYGGRGINVCKEWFLYADIFIGWSLSNGYEKGLEIDRINNDGNYEPSNCRFVTKIINSINTRKRKNNTSRYTGVSYKKMFGNWISYITYENKRYNLGSFKTKEEAVRRRNMFILLNSLPHKIQEVI